MYKWNNFVGIVYEIMVKYRDKYIVNFLFFFFELDRGEEREIWMVTMWCVCENISCETVLKYK